MGRKRTDGSRDGLRRRSWRVLRAKTRRPIKITMLHRPVIKLNVFSAEYKWVGKMYNITLGVTWKRSEERLRSGCCRLKLHSIPLCLAVATTSNRIMRAYRGYCTCFDKLLPSRRIIRVRIV